MAIYDDILKNMQTSFMMNSPIRTGQTDGFMGEIIGKKAVMGALTLYLDFINLFIMLLRLFGQRR